MKSLKYNSIAFLLLLAGLFATITVSANGDPENEYTRTIEKEFPLSANGKLGIVNKYGNVDIRPGQAGKVKLSVTIRTTTKNQEAADAVFERIHIAFDNHPSEVHAQTEIEATSNWKSWLGIGASDEFRIDYVVYAPAKASLELENRYGNIYVGDMNGEARIELKYGDMRLGALSDVDLLMAYAHGTMQSAGDLRADVSYSDLSIGTCGDLALDAKYSDIKFDQIGDLRANTAYVDVVGDRAGSIVSSGKYDDYIVTTVASFEAESKYSTFIIKNLAEYATFQMEYGSLSLGNVATGFTYVDVECSYTDVKIDIEDSAQFVLDAETRYCGIKHSGIEVTTSIDKGIDQKLKGYRGSKDAVARVTARLSYGGLTVK